MPAAIEKRKDVFITDHGSSRDSRSLAFRVRRATPTLGFAKWWDSGAPTSGPAPTRSFLTVSLSWPVAGIAPGVAGCIGGHGVRVGGAAGPAGMRACGPVGGAAGPAGMRACGPEGGAAGPAGMRACGPEGGAAGPAGMRACGPEGGAAGPAGIRACGPEGEATGGAGAPPWAAGVRPVGSSVRTDPWVVPGCPPGGSGRRTWVVAAAAKPAAAAAPGPAGAPGCAPGWPPGCAPGVGRGCTGGAACCPGGATGAAAALDVFAPPGAVGGGCVGGTRGSCTGAAAAPLSGRSAFLPNPSRVKRPCLGDGGGGGSHTGTAS
jgi:hypothetical protein